MTTAREQAREACRQIEGIDFPTEADYADAASDVWEPLLRPFVEQEPVADINDCGYVTCIYCMVDEPPGSAVWLSSRLPVPHLDTCPWKIAKEALGE